VLHINKARKQPKLNKLIPCSNGTSVSSYHIKKTQKMIQRISKDDYETEKTINNE
jgi:hypothetical protein